MKLIILVILSFVAYSSMAQNTTRFSQFNFAQGVNNPSALALDGDFMVDLIMRHQWLGVDGAPGTIALNGQYALDNDNAVGFNYFYDKIGAQESHSFNGQYAYRVRFSADRYLALGASVGIDNRVIIFTGNELGDPNDPAFSTAGAYSRVFFNAGVGLFYNSPNFYFGASIPKLFQNTRIGDESGFQPPRWHYYGTLGGYIPVGSKFIFNPHLQLKLTANAPVSADLILRNTFVNRFSIVVGYRTEQSLIAGVDFLVSQNFRLGYSFNYDIGPLSKVKGMSNELYLGFAFPYNSDRYNFGKRRYLSRKGGYKNDYNKTYHRKRSRRGRKYGRDTRYRGGKYR